MTADTVDVLVIGGGLLGCVTAYHLARAGVETMLVDRGELNREASGTNAGSLHFQILRQPDYSPARMEGLRASVALHVEAARVWRTIEADLGSDLGVRLNGGLMVAETAEELETLRAKVRVERTMGLETQVLSPREILDVAPHLSPNLAGAEYCRDEGFANPLLVTPCFARRGAEAGARLRPRVEVRRIEPRRGGGFRVDTSAGRVAATRIVNAAGAWAGQVAAMVGAELPITGRVLHVNVTEPWPARLGQLVQHVGRRLTLKQTQYGTFVIGGGWPAHLDRDGRKVTRWESLVGNTWLAMRVLPLLRDVHILRTWAGVIPSTPDRMPIISELPGVRGFYVLYSGAGFTLGPVIGRLVAELLSTGRPSAPLAPFALTA